MQYLQYIQPTGNRQTYTDTNLAITDVNTRFVFEYLYYEQPDVPGNNWSELIGTGYPNRIMIGTMSRSVTSTPNIYIMWRNVQEQVYNYTIDGTATFSKNGLTVNGTQVITISNPPSSIEAGVLCIGGVHNAAGDELVNSGIKIGRLKVYDGNDNLIGDFVPANNNGTIGFYDEVGQVFYDSDGSQPWIAGPAASSISVDASKSTLASTGETISISVSCENAWTLSTSGDSFLTFSSTGDTSGATITATASSYTGATDMLEYLTFADSVTGDIAELTIKQRKYVNGQPLYLGLDTINEIYLGLDGISEAYLGEDLVFSTGPFVGLKLTPKNLELKSKQIATGDTFSIFVKSSEDWTISTDSNWFTLSPVSGLGTGEKTVVALTVNDIPTAETFSSISCITANYSASATVHLRVSYGIPDNEIWYATYNEQPITSLNRWVVKDVNNTQMTPNYSTYGKFIFPRKIAYVSETPYQAANNWSNLVELGLPEMEVSMCTGVNKFGLGYFNGNLNYWTRVYGDYPYINDEETMAWGSDGCGSIIAKGKTGELVIPEGVRAVDYYALNKSMYSSVVFPTSFTGSSAYNNGLALPQYALEDCLQLTSIKYQTVQAPPVGGSIFNRVPQAGIAYYPEGGTGYSGNHKPTSFTFQTYS